MAACPSCGHENREGAKFCEECAAPLAAPARALAEERKVVSVLFCDLVGFTAARSGRPRGRRPDALAPMRRWPAPGSRRTEGSSRSSSGTRSSGVFGVPAAHEDDPERAVRAGLRIVEGAEELESRRRRAACAFGSGSTPARRSSASGRARASVSASSRATRSTPPRGSSRSPRRWGWRSGFRPTRRRRPCSTTRSSSPRR